MNRKICVAIATAVGMHASMAIAYPIVDAVAGLPHPELVTVYPDEADKDLYYFVPTSVALVRGDDGKPRFGVQYWGLTGLDPAGVGAAMTFSVKPAYDKKTVDDVANAIKKKNSNARFALGHVHTRAFRYFNGSMACGQTASPVKRYLRQSSPKQAPWLLLRAQSWMAKGS